MISQFYGVRCMESQILLDTYAEVQRRFAHLDDPAHGWEHVERVYKLALHIAEQEGADPFIVGMAALMHDLGRTSNSDSIKHHAELSETVAAEISKLVPWKPELCVTPTGLRAWALSAFYAGR